MTAERRGMLLMMAFGGLWAVVELVAAGAMAHLPIAQIVWLRYAFHLGLMLLLFRPRDGALWRTRRPGLQVFRSLLMFAMPAGYALSVAAGVGVPALMTVFWSCLVLIPAFARIIGGERTPKRFWVTALAAWLGIWLLLGLPVPRSLSLLGFPLLMAASFSLYVVLTRQLRHEPTRANLFHTAFWVLVVLTPAMPFVWVAPTAADLRSMALVGILGLGCLFLIDRMASLVPVSLASPAMAVQMPLFVVADWILGSQPPSLRAVVGVAVVAAAVAIGWGLSGPRHGAAVRPTDRMPSVRELPNSSLR